MTVEKISTSSVDISLKCCPFCGGDPEVDVQSPQVVTNSYWVFLRCKRRCRVGPVVGESCSTGYHADRFKWDSWIPTRTGQEAVNKAYESASRTWNTRFPESN